jgi:myo-inositol-1(or 4)-monophosphatase
MTTPSSVRHVPPDLAAALGVARLAADQAGEIMRRRWDTGVEAGFKGEVDLVTEVDLECEAAILGTLRAAFPDDAIVAEEAGRSGEAGRRLWHVDPLDGTTNFSHGFPQFCTSIALEDAAGLAVGVVHAPVLGWTFYAVRGGGAWREGKRLAVSGVPSLDRALLATGFPYDRRTNPDNNTDRFAHLLRRCQGIRRAGAAALDLAFVAAGWLDGYWETKLHSWDVAAGALLVTEAGGHLSGFDGRAPRLESGELVATNGRFHVELIEALAAGHTAPGPAAGPENP